LDLKKGVKVSRPRSEIREAKEKGQQVEREARAMLIRGWEKRLKEEERSGRNGV